MIVFCFSATGNSLSVARHIARTQADSRIIGIREALETPSAVWEDDAIGVVTPTHTGRMPAPVERFFETADIRTDYLFVVYTCGVTPGLGVNIACRQARHRGLQVAYANSIKMVDDNFMLYDVRRQIETADAKDIPGHTAAIAADIAARRHYIALPSVADRLMGICMKAMPSFKGFYRQYRCDTGRCNGCGICARICPVGAITRDGDGHPEWNRGCIRCTACYHNCPQSAITHAHIRGGYCQFRNPDVTLRDLIDKD